MGDDQMVNRVDAQAVNPDPRRCTCHPDDKPPVPCPQKYALNECRVAALLRAAAPFADHDWYDAELEDDSCKLTRHSGPVTVGHWRELGRAINALKHWR